MSAIDWLIRNWQTLFRISVTVIWRRIRKKNRYLLICEVRTKCEEKIDLASAIEIYDKKQNTNKWCKIFYIWLEEKSYCGLS